jgi:hypothetical protein
MKGVIVLCVFSAIVEVPDIGLEEAFLMAKEALFF